MDSEEVGIKVCCRVRPAGTNPADTKKLSRLDAALVKQQGNQIVIGHSPDTRSFVFDYLAGEDSSQDDMWKNVGLEVCQSSLNGYHGTIIAYGQTGSGKTHTIFGTESEDGRGLVPRALDYIFAYIGSEREKSFLVTANMIEIYNERVFDLLDQSGDAAKQIQVREDTKRGVFVEGAVEEEIASPAEAHRLLQLGNKNRHVGSTVMNRASSRSHAIFVLMIQMTSENDEGLKTQRLSRFNLVDLAGSERQKATQATGAQLREAGQINKSLSALGNVIHALTSKTGSDEISPLKDVKHIAYRDSKLTFLLRDSLGGNSKTVIVATITTLESSLSESVNTLKFAVRAKRIKNKVSKNETLVQGSLAALQREVLQLRAKLALMESEVQIAASIPAASSQSPTHNLRIDLSSPSLDTPQATPRQRALSGASPRGRSLGDFGLELVHALERCQAADELRTRAEQKSAACAHELEIMHKNDASASPAGQAAELIRMKSALEEVVRRMRWTYAAEGDSTHAITQGVWESHQESAFSHELLERMHEERDAHELIRAESSALLNGKFEEVAGMTFDQAKSLSSVNAQLEAKIQSCESELKVTREEAQQDHDISHGKCAELASKVSLLGNTIQELQADKERAIAGAGDELQQTVKAKDELLFEFMKEKESWAKSRGELESVVGDIYAALQEKDSKFIAVTAELEATKALFEELQQKYALASAELTASKVKMVEAVDVAKALHIENLISDEKHRAAQSALHAANIDKEKASYELDELKDQLDSLSMQEATHAREISELAMSQQIAIDRSTRVEKELAAVEERNRILVENANASAEEKERRHDAVLLESLAKHQEAERAISVLEDRIEALDRLHASDASAIARLQEELTESRETQSDFAVSLERSRTQVQRLSQQLEDQRGQCEAAVGEAADLKLLQSALEVTIANAKESEQEAHGRRIAAENVAAKRGRDCDEALLRVVTAESDLEEAATRLQDLETELGSALQRLALAEKAVADEKMKADAAATTLPHSVQDLQQQLADTQAALATSQLTTKMINDRAQKEIQEYKQEAAEAREKASKTERLYVKQAQQEKLKDKQQAIQISAPSNVPPAPIPAAAASSLPLPPPIVLEPASQVPARTTPPPAVSSSRPLVDLGNGLNAGITWGLTPHSGGSSNFNSASPLAPPKEMTASDVLAEFGYKAPSRDTAVIAPRPSKALAAPPVATPTPKGPLAVAQPVGTAPGGYSGITMGMPAASVVIHRTALVTAALPSSNELILPDDGLDDDNFAGVVSTPASSHPLSLASRAVSTLAQSLPNSFSARGPTVSGTTPSPGSSIYEGEISARISTRTFIFKEWQQIYWVIRDQELLLYRNQMDFRYNPTGTQIKKRIRLEKGKIILQPLKCKDYDNAGKMEKMHNFMLDEEHDFGVEHLVKFASSNKHQVDTLYRQLKLALR